MKPVRKAVIAAAGFGTRFLPQTKAMPKEMLPLVDKPVIQYVVEELVSVGVEDIIIVTGIGKRSIEDHFDRPPADLIANLKAGGPSKEPLLQEIRAIADMANFIYVRQKGPYGNGTPLLNAEHLIGDEPFFFTWSDDFFVSQPARFQQMLDAYNEYGCSILSAMKATSDEDYDRYGFAAGHELRPGVIEVNDIVEKPGKEQAPSDLANVSGFLLTPDIFSYLRQTVETLEPGKEIYTNDAIKKMLVDGHKVIALEIANGKYYDAGNKLEYLKTVVDIALSHEDVKDEFREYLRQVIGRSS
ncbi:MAG: sugar phosphate nucleotidyltransferase [Candidatus Saccharibacteria bacterium]|nr:sugar phosphate nucleotidyltransferase [Candidatus Saccharibacteria bacterium]